MYEKYTLCSSCLYLLLRCFESLSGLLLLSRRRDRRSSLLLRSFSWFDAEDEVLRPLVSFFTFTVVFNFGSSSGEFFPGFSISSIYSLDFI